MIKYFYFHLFYTKKRTILILGIIIWIGLMVFIIYTKEPRYEQRLYQLQNQLYYEQMMQNLLVMLCPFFVVILVIDHDQQHLKPMISYLGRSYVALAKLVFYFLVITWLFSIFFMIYHILPFFLTAYYTFQTSSIILFFNLYLDGIIIMFLVFIFIKDNHKPFAIMIALFYIFSSWLIEDHPNIYLFYLFPQYSTFFLTITLAYHYKICYICLGLTIYAYQINFEIL